MLEFRVLGRLSVVRDGTALPLPAPQLARFLAVLLVSAPDPVGPAELSEVLGAAGSGHALHVAVSRLRRWLARTAPGSAVERAGAAYRLRLEGATLDADLVREDLAAAERAPDGVARIAPLDRALRRFGDAVLGGQPTLQAAPAVQMLERLRVDLALRLTQECLAAGRLGPALAQVPALRRENGLDERLAAGHAELLAASGQRAAALDEIDKLRHRLDTELGIDAGAELMAVRLRILQDQKVPSHSGTWRGPRSHVSLIGRAADSAWLGNLIGRHRLTTVTGPGGVGKTVLALDAARRFAGDVAVVPLVGCTGRTDLIAAVAETFGLAATGERDDYERLTHAIGDRPVMLVLDNCEHVRADAAELIRRLLGATTGLTVLATSREPIGVTGEAVWQCPPLPAGVEVELFLQRASEATGGGAVDDREAAQRICRRLDGLPLAIELAAARLRAVSLAELADLVDADLGMLSAGPATGGRHSTVDAVFTGSVRMLSPAERELLARLAVFADGFTLATVDTGPQPVAGLLAVLVDRSLVQRLPGTTPSRYRILEPLRDSARRLLCTAAERDRWDEENLRYWCGIARDVWSEPEDVTRGERFAGLAAEFGNIRHALERGYRIGSSAGAAELTAYLFDGWRLTGSPGEAARWHELAWRHRDRLPAPLRAMIGFNLAIVHAADADHRTVAALTRCLPDLRAFDDREYREALLFLCMLRSRLFARDPWRLPASAARRFSRSQRLRRRLLQVEELTTGGRWTRAKRLLDQPWDTGALTGTEMEVQRGEQTVLTELGLGRMAEAARAEAALTDLARRLAPHPQAAALPSSALMWLVTGDDEYGRRVLDGLDALDDAGVPAYREMQARVLAAEGLRRRGDTDAALAQLRPVFATARLPPRLLMLVAPVTALAAGGDLLATWDGLRQHLGLPVPVGFAGHLAARSIGERADGEPPHRASPGAETAPVRFDRLEEQARALFRTIA